ncbi:MAG: DUF3990 domain-containing protein [Coriobacteriales bacterium]|jgi:hypothetical protein|nr:DUF3990 domain-containing protein [Coriobacteriales bacterium]
MGGIFEELTQTLYHGSYTVVQKPDVTLGAPRKDSVPTSGYRGKTS